MRSRFLTFLGGCLLLAACGDEPVGLTHNSSSAPPPSLSVGTWYDLEPAFIEGVETEPSQVCYTFYVGESETLDECGSWNFDRILDPIEANGVYVWPYLDPWDEAEVIADPVTADEVMNLSCNDSSTISATSIACQASAIRNGDSFTNLQWIYFGPGEVSPGVEAGPEEPSTWTHAPTADGSFVFTATVRGMGMWDEVAIAVRPPPPIFAVYCGGTQIDVTVTRGDGVSCSVKYVSGDTTGYDISVLSWRFEPGPGSSNQSLPVVYGIDNPWAGIAATSGEVSRAVRMVGILDTLEDTLTANITVNARTTTFPTVTYSAVNPATPPLYVVDMAFLDLQELGQFLTVPTSWGGSRDSVQDSGPNSGYVFYNSFPFSHDVYIGIDFAKMVASVNNYLWFIADVSPVDGTCSRDFIGTGPMEAFAKAHEGEYEQQNSHAYFFKDYISGNLSSFRDRAEALVWGAGSSSTDRYNYIFDYPAMVAAREMTHQIPSMSLLSLCRLRLQP
jgi:hypothetical protein